MVDKMASLKSEKDEVESVADSLSEKNVQLQSHIDRVVISRVVSLMRNVSVARAFRTWREWVQAEKIERAEKATHDAAAEKTAALVRASNDEFRLATLEDEVEPRVDVSTARPSRGSHIRHTPKTDHRPSAGRHFSKV